MARWASPATGGGVDPHNLYPLITWDDVWGGKIHRTPGGRTVQQALEALVSGGGQ